MSLEMRFDRGAHRFRFCLRPLRVPPSDDGLFPNGSVIRRVYADSVCGLGAGTALLLQLAHPAIAQGVHDHSDYQEHPLDRLFGTLYSVNTVVFGSRDEARQIGTAIAHVHAKVNGPGYSALDPVLVQWVNATLLGTAVHLYEGLIRPLSAAERNEFVADARVVGEVFGCPIDAQPATWDEFEQYWNGTIDKLHVSDTARRVAHSLLGGRGLPARPLWLPSLALARAVTAATLPDRLRDEYALPWRRVDRAMAGAVLRASARLLPRLPDRWRQMGPELLRAPA